MRYVSENDLMTGLDEKTFGPTEMLARAQFATILYRMAGSPEIDYKAIFPDVLDGGQVTAFAHEAMQWAVAEEIIQGNGEGMLMPWSTIIRAECAAIISRYEEAKTIYMPMFDYTYVNSTNGGFPHTAQMLLEKVDDMSFKFSVWEFIDENGGSTNKEIISERTAVFDENKLGIAVSDEGGQRLELDCRIFGKITINGLEEDFAMGNTFFMLGIGSAFE